jgi:hypothetical protein
VVLSLSPPVGGEGWGEGGQKSTVPGLTLGDTWQNLGLFLKKKRKNPTFLPKAFAHPGENVYSKYRE